MNRVETRSGGLLWLNLAELSGALRPTVRTINFVPLAQPPGEAKFDFGEAVVEIAGVRRKAALAVMSLPYSDAFFVTAFPRECTETFQAAHDNSFEFFGGIPTKIAYDNNPSR